jgi:hypothetical protein
LSPAVDKAQRLLAGESFVSREPGNSMAPRILSRQPVLLEPVFWNQVSKNDVVYCRVHGNFYTHLVLATNPERGCLIGNLKGRPNGWTKKVFGRVKQVFPMNLNE